MAETRTILQPTITARCKSATLTPGYWIYVCPCGGQYRVCRVIRKSKNHACYCYSCKMQTGKYHRVMAEKLEFTSNDCGKLNCTCFTMIRLHNPVSNSVDAVKNIYLKGVWKGDAKIIEVKRIYLTDINQFIAKLDSGLTSEAVQQHIRNRSKNRPGINWDTQLLDLCLLEYIKESKEPKLFT